MGAISKMYIYILYILAVGLFTVHASVRKTHLCVDCRQHLENCSIWDTGYSILESPSRNKGKVALEGTIVDSMDSCIPDGFDIKDKVFDVGCIWSAKLGCQMLVARSSGITKISCIQCLFDKDIKMQCPCQASPTIEPSGSDRIYCSILPILILHQLIFLS